VYYPAVDIWWLSDYGHDFDELDSWFARSISRPAGPYSATKGENRVYFKVKGVQDGDPPIQVSIGLSVETRLSQRVFVLDVLERKETRKLFALST
jgi:hypothetical protein